MPTASDHSDYGDHGDHTLGWRCKVRVSMSCCPCLALCAPALRCIAVLHAHAGSPPDIDSIPAQPNPWPPRPSSLQGSSTPKHPPTHLPQPRPVHGLIRIDTCIPPQRCTVPLCLPPLRLSNRSPGVWRPLIYTLGPVVSHMRALFTRTL